MNRYPGAAAAVLLLVVSSLVLPARAAGPRVTVSPAAGDPDVLELVVEPGPVRWIPAAGAVSPRIEGFGTMTVPGAPEVPVRRERIALPPGGGLRVLSVEADWVEGRIPGPVAPYPAFDPHRPPLLETFEEDEGWWPAQPAEIVVANGAFRSLRFAEVELRPLDVDPASSRYRLARRLVVRLERTGGIAGAGHSPLAAGAGRDLLVDRLGATVAWGAQDVPRTPLAPSAPEPLGARGGATYPAWQFTVNRDGLYRVTYEWAQANAPALFSYLTSHDPRRYRLTCQGVEIPILVEGESDGSFDPGDAIVFYGQEVGRVDLFDDDVWENGDYTDTNVYRLDLADGPSRIEADPGTRAPSSGHPVPSSFRQTVHHEEDEKFLGFIPHDGVDHWYVDPFLIADHEPAELDQLVDTPGHAGGEVELRVRQLGFDYADNYHRTELLVDGVSRDTADWEGNVEFTQGVDSPPVRFTPEAPLGTTTRVTVRLPLGRHEDGKDITLDEVAVNWVEIDYDRKYEAHGDHLLFTTENADREIHLSGFSGLAETWETTRTVLSDAGMEISLPRRVEGVTWSSGENRFELDEDGDLPATRRFAAAAGDGFLVPGVREDRPPSDLDAALGDSLKADGLGADWVVIGWRPLLDPSPGSQLDRLVQHRRAQGLATALVDLQDVYDEFSFGIQDPQAIRDFVRWTLENWNPAPSFVVLVGDSSWDYKNVYGFDPPRMLVPTYMWDITENTQFGHYPSDTWFTAVLGEDELPDAVVGRIPAHTLAEAEEVFRKIVDYETGPVDLSWVAKALLVSENDGDEFIRVHDEIYEQWFTGDVPEAQRAEKIYEQDPDVVGCQQAADDENDRIDAGVNGGGALLTYAGHGGYKVWGRGCTFFDTDGTGPDDLDDIQEDTPLPFTVHANCVTGNHAATSSPGSSNDAWYTFLEDWLTTARKGVVGGMAPGHLTYSFQLDGVLDPIYEEIFGKHKERLVANLDMRIRNDFEKRNSTTFLRSFSLQADPATRLRIPAPPAPEITSIDPGGSGELRIEWTSVPEADSYRVYRAKVPNGTYERVAETEETSYLDTGLTNCTSYYYYVVAVDENGFESRWSNYNETCIGGDPDPDDCKSGTPENPDPPHAPTLLSVTDTREGGKLRVHWDNTDREPDVLWYRVQWGTTAGGPYPSEERVGAELDTLVVGGLEDGVEYFFVVRAEHCSKISDPSNELSGIPHMVRGINPPRAIGDLMVYRQEDAGGPDDLRLEWTPPTDTVWGVGTTVVAQKVYGSDATPVFAADAGHDLSGDLAPDAAEWVHADQGEPSGAATWFYLVVARDDEGYESAAGVELPGPVEDLRVIRHSATGEVELRWNPVDETMDGRRLHVAAYDVHGRDSILPRKECSAGNLVVGDVPQQSGEISVRFPMPEGSLYTWQVLAKDVHGSESVW